MAQDFWTLMALLMSKTFKKWMRTFEILNLIVFLKDLTACIYILKKNCTGIFSDDISFSSPTHKHGCAHILAVCQRRQRDDWSADQNVICETVKETDSETESDGEVLMWLGATAWLGFKKKETGWSWFVKPQWLRAWDKETGSQEGLRRPS